VTPRGDLIMPNFSEEKRLCAYTICTPMPAVNRISATSTWSGSRSGEAASFPSACQPPVSSSATQAEHDVDWHPAPRRQYIINLDAGVRITASDGESRVIGIGDVILVEDTTGKGHLSQHVEGKIRHSIFVPVD
jgi:hypothetical protein